jgi:gliding motility-associated lipoprotein GldD
MRSITLLVSFISVLALLSSCGDDELTIPKPPTFLRSELPDHEYTTFKDHAHFSCDFSKNYLVKPVLFGNVVTDHLEVNLGPLNGTLYVNYFPLPNRDTLVRYINLSNDKVDEHQMKADRIIDKQLIDKNKKVYGTFFEFQGNVATNFQFYLTDSVNHFVRGEVLMNCRPNYDSLRPSLDYLKQDLLKLFESFEWKK